MLIKRKTAQVDTNQQQAVNGGIDGHTSQTRYGGCPEERRAVDVSVVRVTLRRCEKSPVDHSSSSMTRMIATKLTRNFDVVIAFSM